MAKAGYTVGTASTGCSISATAKTCLMVIAPSQFGIDLVSFDVAFDGVTASNPSAFVELVSSTQATAGTPGTSPTPLQAYGRAITVGFTAAQNYSAEPTVLTTLEEFRLSPNAGLVIRDFPAGKSYDQDVSKGLGIRITASAAVNAWCNMTFERC